MFGTRNRTRTHTRIIDRRRSRTPIVDSVRSVVRTRTRMIMCSRGCVNKHHITRII